jgi:hypothetical protein
VWTMRPSQQPSANKLSWAWFICPANVKIKITQIFAVIRSPCKAPGLFRHTAVCGVRPWYEFLGGERTVSFRAFVLSPISAENYKSKQLYREPSRNSIRVDYKSSLRQMTGPRKDSSDLPKTIQKQNGDKRRSPYRSSTARPAQSLSLSPAERVTNVILRLAADTCVRQTSPLCLYHHVNLPSNAEQRRFSFLCVYDALCITSSFAMFRL